MSLRTDFTKQLRRFKRGSVCHLDLVSSLINLSDFVLDLFYWPWLFSYSNPFFWTFSNKLYFFYLVLIIYRFNEDISKMKLVILKKNFFNYQKDTHVLSKDRKLSNVVLFPSCSFFYVFLLRKVVLFLAKVLYYLKSHLCNNLTSRQP